MKKDCYLASSLQTDAPLPLFFLIKEIMSHGSLFLNKQKTLLFLKSNGLKFCFPRGLNFL